MFHSNIVAWDPFREVDRIFTEAAQERPSSGPFELEVPGVKIEDISVSLEDGFLAVKWKDRHGTERFSRRRVGNAKDARASLADGVLIIELEKSEGRKVEIRRS